MVIERLVRPRDPEEQTIIEELDEIFESGDLRKWASELGVRFILAIEESRSRRPLSRIEGEEDRSAIVNYLVHRQDTFEQHPELYQRFMQGQIDHLRELSV